MEPDIELDMELNVIVTSCGDKEWWTAHGIRHRTDGPAVERSNGNNIWYVRGKCHRLDGPAIEYANGKKSWYLFGNCLSFDDWLDRTPALTHEEKVMYKLQHG
jgi:hypothetical protein